VDDQRHYGPGRRIEVCGCDLWTFGDDGRITRKDSFWKIRDT
jgi:hypothetical protein